MADPMRILLAGRQDGIGCRLSCFIAAVLIAEEQGLQLRFLWPKTGVLYRNQIAGDVADIFPSVGHLVIANEAEIIEPFTIVQRFSKWYLPERIQDLRKTLQSLELAICLQKSLSHMQLYDYAIHARVGDVLQMPLFFGSTKVFPRCGYLQIIRTIATRAPQATIFLATDDPSLATQAKAIHPLVFTEEELMSNVGFNDTRSIVKLWAIASQLSKTRQLICPPGSGFSMLSKIIRLHPFDEIEPAEFLGIADIYHELNILWTQHAIRVLGADSSESEINTRRMRHNLDGELP